MSNFFAHRGEEFGSFQKLVLRNSRNAFDHLGRVAIVLLLEQLIHAAGMLQGKIKGNLRRKQGGRRIAAGSFRTYRARRLIALPATGLACVAVACGNCTTSGDWHELARQITALFIIPAGFVVSLLACVKAGIQAVIGKLETLLDDECRVGVVDKVVLGDAVVLERVPDHTAQKCNVGAGTDLKIEIGGSGGARETWINHDGLRVTMDLGFDGPLKSTRVVLGRIAPHDQHHVGVLDVDPAIGHRSASECWPQTGDRGTVSNTGLVFQVADPQAAHALDD